MQKMDYPEGATPLDPDELEGLKFKHITTRGQITWSKPIFRKACAGFPGERMQMY